MKLGLEHAAVIALCAAGGYWLFFREPSESVVTSGTVTLEPKVPYRLSFESSETVTDYPMNATLVDRQNEIRAALVWLNAFDVSFAKLPEQGGGSRNVVSFRMTPLAPVSLTVGAPLDSTTKWGPRLSLYKVERLDGKRF